jgi:hypothetical protein
MVLSIVIIPFLLVAFVVLYFWPSADDTARLFAWRIVPGFTSMALASAYLGGAYFFLRAARAKQWHTVGGGFIPVALFASLMGIATITHWDKFIHTNVAFWLWATLYFTTPVLVIAIWLLNRRQRSEPSAGDLLLSPSTALLFGALETGTSDRFLDPSVFDPNLPSNLTWMIQGLIVLLVSTDVIALKILRSGWGVSLTFKRRAKREEASA